MSDAAAALMQLEDMRVAASAGLQGVSAQVEVEGRVETEISYFGIPTGWMMAEGDPSALEARGSGDRCLALLELRGRARALPSIRLDQRRAVPLYLCPAGLAPNQDVRDLARVASGHASHVRGQLEAAGTPVVLGPGGLLFGGLPAVWLYRAGSEQLPGNVVAVVHTIVRGHPVELSLIDNADSFDSNLDAFWTVVATMVWYQRRGRVTGY